MTMTLSVQEHDALREPQDIDCFNISGTELLSLMAMFDPIGIWCIDLETSRIKWSRDIFEVQGKDEISDESSNLQEAFRAWHPEDRQILAGLIDETIVNKLGFRAVLRLKRKDGSNVLAKIIGKYRVTNGREEIIGLCSRIAHPIRSIAIAK